MACAKICSMSSELGEVLNATELVKQEQDFQLEQQQQQQPPERKKNKKNKNKKKDNTSLTSKSATTSAMMATSTSSSTGYSRKSGLKEEQLVFGTGFQTGMKMKADDEKQQQQQQHDIVGRGETVKVENNQEGRVLNEQVQDEIAQVETKTEMPNLLTAKLCEEEQSQEETQKAISGQDQNKPSFAERNAVKLLVKTKVLSNAAHEQEEEMHNKNINQTAEEEKEKVSVGKKDFKVGTPQESDDLHHKQPKLEQQEILKSGFLEEQHRQQLQAIGDAILVTEGIETQEHKRHLIGEEFYTTNCPKELIDEGGHIVVTLPAEVINSTSTQEQFVVAQQQQQQHHHLNHHIAVVSEASIIVSVADDKKLQEEGVSLIYPISLDGSSSGPLSPLTLYNGSTANSVVINPSSHTLAVSTSDNPAANGGGGGVGSPVDGSAQQSPTNGELSGDFDNSVDHHHHNHHHQQQQHLEQHHQSHHHHNSGLTDMAAILAQAVKNEPEDLTGHHRRGSPDQHENSIHGLKDKSTLSHHSTNNNNNNNSVVVSTPDGPVVLTAGELSSFNPIVTTSGGSSYTDFCSPIYASEPFALRGTSGTTVGNGTGSGNSNGGEGNDLYHGPVEFSRSSSTGGDVHFVNYHYKGTGIASGNGPHLNSPDSGIGDPNVTPTTPGVGPGGEVVSAPFDNYPHADLLNDLGNPGSVGSAGTGGGGRRPWQDYGRQNEEKIHIPKIFNNYGFRYTLEAPSSSSVRREDDKITYVNKGQFYGITLEYSPDPESPPLKSSTVKSIIMLVFREGKTIEEELKAWQFWHARQHSVKQRILDADTKNAIGLVGNIEEISHNALAVYWNPLESPAKVNIAVQCLSTDFSTQKGVKGLPLHVQIDTYDDPRDSPGGPVYHRGYGQIKVFCDKGAERKARDEERRASKRRMTTSGKRRLDEMYHQAVERSEFYSMADLNRPPVLFTPSDDPEKASLDFGTELPSFYSSRSTPPESLMKINGNPASDPGVPESVSPNQLYSPVPPVVAALRTPVNSSLELLPPPEKRLKLVPPSTERIMIYVRQETEDAFTALHLVPPSVPGLISAIESKYKINAANIRYLYRKSKQQILAKIDDDMLRFYCNEDVFLMQVMVTEGSGGEDSMVYDITLSEC